eukprot:7707473-Karenia_brevis.AAC.1
MQEYVSDREGGTKLRTCVLEPGRKACAIRDLNGKQYGQFGPRAHLNPKSEEGKAHMSNPECGWLNSCTRSFGWGVPISGQSHVVGGSAEYRADGSPSVRAPDGNIVTD